MKITIGVFTGGGDAPGLNAYLFALSSAAAQRQVRVLAIRNGLDGLLAPERYPAGGMVDLDTVLCRHDLFEPGSVIGSASGGFPALSPEYAADLAGMLRTAGIDALVSIGGDGTQQIARALHRAGFPVVALPKTIDNDLPGVEGSIGFASAVSFLADSLRDLRRHAETHARVVLLEAMGRNSGFLALAAALAGAADGVLLPEIPYSYDALSAFVGISPDTTPRVLVVAEGASELGEPAPPSKGLGGVSLRLAERLSRSTGREVRAVVPAHLQRCVPPEVTDRLLGLRLGSSAIDRILTGDTGVLLYWDGSRPRSLPLGDVSGVRTVPVDAEDLRTARALGMFLGS